MYTSFIDKKISILFYRTLFELNFKGKKGQGVLLAVAMVLTF